MLALVRALEDGWQGVIDGVLGARGAPTTREPVALGRLVAELSQAYNAGAAGDGARGGIDARIGFSFARDVPKAAGAVRELVALGALTMPEGRALSIVDLGAGIGAMTWGIVRALEAAGGRGKVEALLVDDDAEALACAEALAREAAREGVSGVEVALRTRSEGLSSQRLRLFRADLVIMGQVLSELDRAEEPGARAERHAGMIRAALDVAETVVVVEPALRDRTRHLHAVRDRLAAAGQAIFAPCLHGRPCPVLESPSDWCHEDLSVDLPAWLVPVARAAGLRWQGLTFSYLALRRDGATLGSAIPQATLRIISERMITKGKSEVFGCTSRGERVRYRRLDRDASEANAAWDELGRGDVVTLTPGAVDERGRLAADAGVDVRRVRK